MDEEKILGGIVASAGTAKGDAIVIRDIEENIPDLKGKVVILKDSPTDIADKIMGAAGIISETGGLLCHLAIVAREMGIPFLTQVENATNMIENGEHIEIVAEKIGKIIKHGK